MLFIFDWDGTLCDSTSKIVKSMQAAATSLGLKVPEDEQVLNIIGLALPEAIKTLYHHFSDEQVLKLRDTYSQHFLRDDTYGMPLFSGVEATLHDLRDQGYRMAIATGKSRQGLQRVLEDLGLQNFFDISRCADETRSKPHPQMLLEILAEMHASADESVMVGDTEYDMAMAEGIAMPRIAVSYGAHAIERLIPYQPKLCLDYFPDIKQMIL